MRTKHLEVQEWWAALSGGERRLICALMRMLKGAKRSQVKEVARAAAKWESGIGFFIKVRLMHQRPRRLHPNANAAWIEVHGKPRQTPNPPVPLASIGVH